MRIRDASAAARRWVAAHGPDIPGFAGAFLHGSAAWMADDAELPAGSDVDVMVVLDGPAPPQKLGKLVYEGVLLEVSYIQQEELATPEQVLANSHLAGSLRAPGVLADPSGRLGALHAAVAADFARPTWARARCRHVEAKIRRNLASLAAPAPLHAHVSAWLFGAGLTTHLLLVAGLRNPTVRKRYLAARELLAERGRPDVYAMLLDLLGCTRMSRERAAAHLAALEELFDTAAQIIRTPVFFAADISPAARAVAIDGSRTLIARGDQREAVFWIVATASRCLQVLDSDGTPAQRARFLPGYWRLLNDLGIQSPADLPARGEQVLAALPELWQVAEAIIGAA